MASVNRAILLGNLGRDPEVRHTVNGATIANFTIATSRTWKDKATGDKKEDTQWHRLTCYGRLAEIAGEYLKKGSSVYVEGRIETRKWTDKDGADRYTTEIQVENLTMLGKPTTTTKQSSEDSDSTPRKPSQETGRQPRASMPHVEASRISGGVGDMEDDIPF